MDLNQLYLTNNECYQVGAKMKPIGVMWHSTGANNPTLKRYVGPDDGKLGNNRYGNHWNQFRPDGRQVCVHGFIGRLENGNIATYQTLPFDMKGWHAGGSANNNYVGFEICEDGLDDIYYFNAVYQEAVEFSAFICKQQGLDPLAGNTIICHSDGYKLGIASNHSDVYHWFNRYGKTMDNVRLDIKNAMNPKPPFQVRGHIQNEGWQSWQTSMVGTIGKSLRLEALQFDTELSLGRILLHLQDVGWVDYTDINKDTIIGSVNQSRRIECIEITCPNMEYRVHQEGIGWTSWTKADGISSLGSVGQGLRLEAIEFRFTD